MGRYVKHIACNKCGSSDGNAIYEDGSTYCWVCGTSAPGDGKTTYKREELTGRIGLDDIKKLPMDALEDRGISKETCEKFGVRVEYDQNNGTPWKYYFPLYSTDGLVGYQVRTLPKEIARTAGTSGSLPFGAHLVGNSGKFLIVVEGAEDCMAAFQMLAEKGKQYRVVATLGTDTWKRNIEYFKSFDKVVICFDKDAAGETAAKEFGLALGSKRAFLMGQWQGKAKDPNDLLKEKGGADKFLNALFKAEEYRPDGIITGEEVWRRMEHYTKPKFIPYPPEWVQMNAKMEGMREAEISLWTAGTSVGKTSYIRRLKQHVLTNTDVILGEVELEESPEKTWRGLMQFHGRMPLSQMSPEYKRKVYEETYGTQRIFTIDHRNQFTRGQSLIGKFEYLHYTMGAQVIFLDHITLAVSEFGDGGGLSDQDRMMNEFLEFVEKTKTHLCIISHLRKSPSGGRSFEEGAVPSEDDLKGSGSLKQISFDIIGVSRNKQHPDPYMRNVSNLHVLKCRETGDTGPADVLYWDKNTMSLVPAEIPEEEDDDYPPDDDAPPL